MAMRRSQRHLGMRNQADENADSETDGSESLDEDG